MGTLAEVRMRHTQTSPIRVPSLTSPCTFDYVDDGAFTSSSFSPLCFCELAPPPGSRRKKRQTTLSMETLFQRPNILNEQAVTENNHAKKINGGKREAQNSFLLQPITSFTQGI